MLWGNNVYHGIGFLDDLFFPGHLYLYGDLHGDMLWRSYYERSI